MSTISDTRVDRYYYIFDSRSRRAVVLDRTTGDEYDWDGEARVQLLRHARKQAGADEAGAGKAGAEASGDDDAGARLLRRFAAWCARQTGAPDAGDDTVRRLWTAARQMEEGRSYADSDATRARQTTDAAALMALTVGLPRKETDAARLLTAQACTHADPFDAAVDAAHMSERWAEFSDGDSPAAAARSMRERQVDWLLDRLLE